MIMRVLSIEYESETKRYPRREKNPPEYLGQHEVNAQNNDLTNINVVTKFVECHKITLKQWVHPRPGNGSKL